MKKTTWRKRKKTVEWKKRTNTSRTTAFPKTAAWRKRTITFQIEGIHEEDDMEEEDQL